MGERGGEAVFETLGLSCRKGLPARTPFPWVAGGTIARHPIRTHFFGCNSLVNRSEVIMKALDSEFMSITAVDSALSASCFTRTTVDIVLHAAYRYMHENDDRH